VGSSDDNPFELGNMTDSAGNSSTSIVSGGMISGINVTRRNTGFDGVGAIAFYDNNRLLSMRALETSETDPGTIFIPLNIRLPNDASNVTARLFIWDDFVNMEPLNEDVRHDMSNFALNTTATASNVHSDGHSASLLTNGTRSNRWAARDPGASRTTIRINLDLGQVRTFNQVVIDEFRSRIGSFNINVSSNGTSWTTAHTGTSPHFGINADRIWTVDLDTPVTTRHFQLEMLVPNPSVSFEPSIYQLELYDHRPDSLYMDPPPPPAMELNPPMEKFGPNSSIPSYQADGMISTADISRDVDWSEFLDRNEPEDYDNGAFIGNGVFGTMFWLDPAPGKRGLYFEISRSDVYARRLTSTTLSGGNLTTNTHGNHFYRLTNGFFNVEFSSKPTGDLRLDLPK
jgi:hypothetical protein